MPHIFSVSADVVGRLRVVGTFCQPLPYGCAVCGGVVHLPTLKTNRQDEENTRDTERRGITQKIPEEIKETERERVCVRDQC